MTNVQDIVDRWIASYEHSRFRMPGRLDRDPLLVSMRTIVEEFVAAMPCEWTPGSPYLREVEQAVSFWAATLSAQSVSGFDVGALFFSLRDVWAEVLPAELRGEIRTFMDWLVVLAADSMLIAKASAARERWDNELDECTPLVMISPEIPAIFLVCRPSSRVLVGVLGRLLLTVVRTDAKSVLIDVRGLLSELDGVVSDALQTFLSHPRISGSVVVFLCGVANSKVPQWKQLGEECGASLVFDSYFDRCVAESFKLAGATLRKQ